MVTDGPMRPGRSYARLAALYFHMLAIAVLLLSGISSYANDALDLNLELFLICLLLGLGLRHRVEAFRQITVALCTVACFVCSIFLAEALLQEGGPTLAGVGGGLGMLAILGAPLFLLLSPKAKAEFSRGRA